MKRYCDQCKTLIPEERLRLLPETATCVNCSRVKPKTISDIQVDGTDPEDLIDTCQYPDR